MRNLTKLLLVIATTSALAACSSDVPSASALEHAIVEAMVASPQHINPECATVTLGRVNAKKDADGWHWLAYSNLQTADALVDAHLMSRSSKKGGWVTVLAYRLTPQGVKEVKLDGDGNLCAGAISVKVTNFTKPGVNTDGETAISATTTLGTKDLQGWIKSPAVHKTFSKQLDESTVKIPMVLTQQGWQVKSFDSL